MGRLRIHPKTFPFKIFKVKFEFVDFDRLKTILKKYEYMSVYGEIAVMVWVPERDLGNVLDYIGKEHIEGKILDMNLKNENGRLGSERMRRHVVGLVKMINM